MDVRNYTGCDQVIKYHAVQYRQTVSEIKTDSDAISYCRQLRGSSYRN